MRIDKFLAMQQMLADPIYRVLVPLLRQRQRGHKVAIFRDPGPHIQVRQLTRRGLIYRAPEPRLSIEAIVNPQARCLLQPVEEPWDMDEDELVDMKEGREQ